MKDNLFIVMMFIGALAALYLLVYSAASLVYGPVTYQPIGELEWVLQ